MTTTAQVNLAKVQTVPALLAEAGQAFGFAPALKLRGGLWLQKYTYAELAERAERMANLLLQRGICQGERVVLWAPNSPAWVIAYLGILRVGAVAVPLDVRCTPDFAAKVVSQTQARLAVATEPLPDGDTSATVPCLTIRDLLLALPACTPLTAPCTAQPSDLAEIMYTSGTTGLPKGVMLSHRNLLSNVKMALDILHLAKGFRILSVLPLSHMFEQVVGLLVPLASGASIVYVPSRQPTVLVENLRRERICAMALVPQAIALIMRNLEHELERRGLGGWWSLVQRGALRLPMRLRRLLTWPVHRSLGGSLQFLVSGGAALPPLVAQKWECLGIPVLEGYGGSEATAIVSANLLDRRRAQSVGRPAPGLTVRIAADDEILVRGDNVFGGYWQNPEATRQVLVDGWLHTGDLGRLDADGFLYFRGRKKNLIALADGMKVHAEDVEDVLRAQAGVRDAVVLGLSRAERVDIHAVILADTPDTAIAAQAVRAANMRLAAHQRIQSSTLWDGDDFPRTPTLKVKRHEVMQRVVDGSAAPAETPPVPPMIQGPKDARTLLASVLHVPVESIQPAQQLGLDLGLDSLSLVELLVMLEEQLGVHVDEQQLSLKLTVADLETLAAQRADPSPGGEIHFSRWPLSAPAQIIRSGVQRLLLDPLLATMVQLTVAGQARAAAVRTPCIVICNHGSHLDTPVLVRALPAALRRSLAVAAAADYWYRNPVLGILVGLAYNLYPMVRDGSARASLEHTVDLLDRGWSVLIFPEGTRSTNGQMHDFRMGIGLLASQTAIPIVPAHIAGAAAVLPKGGRRPRRGPVTVGLGEAVMYPHGSDPAAVTRDLQQRVAAL